MIAEDDKVIKIIQSSTRGLLASFRNKTQLLKECSNDIKMLIREGYDINTAREADQESFWKIQRSISCYRRHSKPGPGI